MDVLAGLEEAARLRRPEVLGPLMAADVEFAAPASARLVFRGRADVISVLGVLFSTFSELVPRATGVTDGHVMVVVDGRFGPFWLTDAMLVEVTEHGGIRRLEPHLRPWPSATLFIVLAGARLLRRPRLLRRAVLGGTRRTPPVGR